MTGIYAVIILAAVPFIVGLLFVFRRDPHYLCLWLPVVVNLAAWVCIGIWQILEALSRGGFGGLFAMQIAAVTTYLLMAAIVAWFASPPRNAWRAPAVLVALLITAAVGVWLWEVFGHAASRPFA